MQLMLPTIAPDMSLYSLLAVAQRLNGTSKAESVSQILFSNPSSAMRHDFPSNLDEFCRKTGNSYGNPTEVATNTSVLPYFLRFRPDSVHHDALALMIGPTVEPLKFILGLPAGPTGAMMPLCYCSECLQEDTREFGYPYWHLQHQLPSALVCHKHFIPLHYTSLRLDGRGRASLFLPDDIEVQKSLTLPLLGRAKPILKRLSMLSSIALKQELSAPYSAESLKTTYLHGLKQQGLLTASGRVRAQDFIGRITKHYDSLSGLSPFDRIIGKDVAEGILKLVRKPRGNFHTACHLILIDFLFGDWKLFNSVYLWERQMDLPFPQQNENELLYSNPRPKNYNLEHGLLELVARYQNNEGSLTSLANELNININTAMRWLGKLGLIEIPHKPKIVTKDIRKGVIEQLKHGQPLKEIASLTGLSGSTIDRICNEEPCLQQIWKYANKEWKREKSREKLKRFLKKNPTLTATELRQSTDSGYSWLSRHDWDWLSKNLPQKQSKKRIINSAPKPRIDWSRRDEECLIELKKLGPLCLESWERLKPKAILRRLPKLSFSPRLEQLPKSQVYVASMLDKLNTR